MTDNYGFYVRPPSAKAVWDHSLLMLGSQGHICEHCSQIWRPVLKTNLEKFEAMQKRGIKWGFNEDFCSYTRLQYHEKLRQLDILPLIHKFNFNELVLFTKFYISLLNFYVSLSICIKSTSQNTRYTRYTRSMTSSDDL